ncbi:MAG: phosphoenolpyruvate carboxykinase (ATP) [Candidatus Zixiibacteriota bacterium]|nr:MAG: phosphoenolpyruvate carboxykinase (ATP) [candidate division Zixibacteria bacterium]
MSREKYESSYGLENHGIKNIGRTCWNLHTPALYEEIIKRGEGNIAHLGPIVVRTGQYTGRAAKDKFIVEEPLSKDLIWWGDSNQPFDRGKFDNLFHKILAYLQGKDLFIQDCFAGADPEYRMPIRIVTETAWHSLFARNMFIQQKNEDLKNHIPVFTVLHVPNFRAVPEIDNTNSEAFVILNLEKKMVIIGGTSYAGEIKKSIFTVLNYILPQKNVLSMHCSANIGANGDTALFFGLSGTGKTTLSADPHRMLIGDDEHGWSENGIFNFEGGCYAKVIRLSAEKEPEIYQTTRRFGTVLENVGFVYDNGRIDLEDADLTENTRAAYPLSHIPNVYKSTLSGHPANIFMLTCDAFGVMPPIAKLSPEMAMFHFISGYTAKLGGTEKGMGNEPRATFSACFGAPFMALHPTTYTGLLAEKVRMHKVNCWLVNTGWTGGSCGEGKRIDISHTRAMINAALSGSIDNVEMMADPVFHVNVPTGCPGVPSEILDPRNTWSDKEQYDQKAGILAKLFNENIKRFEVKDSPKMKGVPVGDSIISG